MNIMYADIIICEVKIQYGEETVDHKPKSFLKKLSNCKDVPHFREAILG